MPRWPLVVSQALYSLLWDTQGEAQRALPTISTLITHQDINQQVILGWATTLNVFESLTTPKRSNIKTYSMSSGEAMTLQRSRRGLYQIVRKQKVSLLGSVALTIRLQLIGYCTVCNAIYSQNNNTFSWVIIITVCIETDSEIDISTPLFAIILIRQYRSILLPSSKAQAEVAFAELTSAPSASKTVVIEDSKFTLAEPKHQKNRLRRDPAMVRCLVQSGLQDFTSSHIATRLNG